MAKYLKRSTAGTLQEESSVLVSVGASSAGLIPQLDSNGKLDPSTMPSGIGADTHAATASEALSAGAIVNLYNNAGALGVRNADNTVAGKEANGFVLAAVANAATATVYVTGDNNQVTGLTIGSYYFLGTGGAVTATAPTSTGNISQRVGYAISATLLQIRLEPPITLA